MDDISRRTYQQVFTLADTLAQARTSIALNADWQAGNYTELIALLEGTITKLKLLKDERIKSNG